MPLVSRERLRQAGTRAGASRTGLHEENLTLPEGVNLTDIVFIRSEVAARRQRCSRRDRACVAPAAGTGMTAACRRANGVLDVPEDLRLELRCVFDGAGY